MIDSSGRKALRADGTVLDLMPVGQTLVIVGGLLIALFVLVRPEASSGLGAAGRMTFWTLHVGLGLAALRVASRWLASRERLPSGTLAAVLVTGCAAILFAAPGYLALDALFAPHVIDLEGDPAGGNLALRLVGEALELAPWFLAAWLLINLPVLLPSPPVGLRLNDAVSHDRAPQIDTRGERFLSSLPGIVGTDVVAVASDLHYLNVWTVAGRTTVLGNLRDVVADLGDVGMQVHRSHWVAHAHVRRIVGTASDAACILSNELRVPVSRRRWKAVREHYGRGVVHVGTPSGQGEAPTRSA